MFHIDHIWRETWIHCCPTGEFKQIKFSSSELLISNSLTSVTIYETLINICWTSKLNMKNIFLKKRIILLFYPLINDSILSMLHITADHLQNYPSILHTPTGFCSELQQLADWSIDNQLIMLSHCLRQKDKILCASFWNIHIFGICGIFHNFLTFYRQIDWWRK